MTPSAMRRPCGFTLIEIIVTLVLLGLLGATVFGFMGQAVRGFFIARDALEITQKAQIALNRMRIELTYLDKNNVSASSSSAITYQTNISGATSTDTIAFDAANSRITFNGVTLIDDVGGLTFSYYNDPSDTTPASSYQASTTLVGITLVMLDSDGNTATFTTRVVPGKIT